MIVGEAPGREEAERGMPFVGNSGEELSRMLAEAGIVRSNCFVTNAVKEQPAGNKIDLWINPRKTRREGEVRFRNKWVRPNVAQDVEELHADLRAINPRVIIPVGNSALWAVTPHSSVAKWRGSYLRSDIGGVDGVVIPTYHPAAVLRQYEWRNIAVRDLRRAFAASRDGPPDEPKRDFRICDTYAKAVAALAELEAQVEKEETIVVHDIEVKRREVVCVGLGWSLTDALCISFYDYSGRTMTAEQSADVWMRIWTLSKHRNFRLANQNIMFDIFVNYVRAGVWLNNPWFDTMVAQNVILPGTPKRLDYLASLYARYYVYWKDDGKFWDKPIIFEQLWHYNCLDCVYTYECLVAQRSIIAKLNLYEQMEEQMELMRYWITNMFRGVRVDEGRRAPLRAEIEALIGVREKQGAKNVRVRRGRFEDEVDFMAGLQVDAFSWVQLQRFFYERMGHKPVLQRKIVDGKVVMKPTTDDDAMVEIALRDPILAPICSRINLIRSYNTALEKCRAKTDDRGRWCASFNIAGTENYRFSSDANPMGEATNVQNLTTGKEIK